MGHKYAFHIRKETIPCMPSHRGFPQTQGQTAGQKLFMFLQTVFLRRSVKFFLRPIFTGLIRCCLQEQNLVCSLKKKRYFVWEVKCVDLNGRCCKLWNGMLWGLWLFCSACFMLELLLSFAQTHMGRHHVWLLLHVSPAELLTCLDFNHLLY